LMDSVNVWLEQISIVVERERIFTKRSNRKSR